MHQRLGIGVEGLRAAHHHPVQRRVQRGQAGFGIDRAALDARGDAALHGEGLARHRGGIDQLFARPFATVPYLGRGGGNPILESQLQQGETIRDLKSVSTISETTYIDYNQYPMSDDLRKQISNPANSVEELAMNGWIRGGASSRD